jgi:hypothetical protein
MASTRIKQHSFVAGLITREAVERADKAQIYHGLLRADNVRVDSHGGIGRRPGTRYVAAIADRLDGVTLGYTISCPNGGDYTLLTDGDPDTYFKTTAQIGTTDTYVCFVVSFTSPTYLDYFDVYGASLDNGDNRFIGGSEEFYVQYSTDGENWTTAKRMYLSYINDDYYRASIGEQVNYIRVVRIGDSDLGSAVFWANGIALWTFSGEQSGFRLSSLVYGASANFLLVFSHNALRIYRNSMCIAECPVPFLAPEYLQQIKFCTYGESVIVTHKDIAPFMIQRYLSDNQWRIYPLVFSNVPYYDAELQRERLQCNAAVVNENESYTVKSDNSVFLSSDVGCILSGNGGRGRIIQYISGTNVRISVINKFAFYGESPKMGGWVIDRNTKPLWGPEYGYGECSAIFANRLFFGGFKRAPDVICGSVIGDFLNFSTGDLQADDAMVVRLSTGKYNHNIRFIHSCDNLEVFSDIGIFALKKFDSGSITDLASSFYLRKNIGISPWLAPFRTDDSGTIFLKSGRADIRELAYSNDTYSYDARSLTLWCTDAVRDTVSIGVMHRPANNVSTYVYCVRSDGGLGCLNFLLADDIHAATNWITAGKFLACESTLQDSYVAVSRQGRILLERIDESAYLDSEVCLSPCNGGTITGLEHLADKIVHVRADGEFLGGYKVSENGTLLLPEGEWENVHIGLPIRCVIIPMPPENTQEPLLGRWMNYSQAILSVYDTEEIVVNGAVPEYIGRDFWTYNQTPLEKKNGRYRVYLGGSGQLLPTLTITQNKPLTFNIRAVIYEVGVN